MRIHHLRRLGVVACILAMGAGRLAAAEAEGRHAAPASDVLTLEAAWQLATRQHPDLRIVAAERDAAEALQHQASALPNPELSAQVEDTRADTRTTTVLWNQPIEWAGKRAARAEAAQWALQQADTDAQARMALLRARLIQRFHGAATAQERVNNANDMVGLAKHAHDAATRRVAAGEAPPIEAVKTQVAATQAEAAQRRAHGEWRVAWQLLRQATGSDLPGYVQVQSQSGQLPSPARWNDIASRVGDAALTRRAQQEVARQRALAEVERTRTRPDVVLQLGVKRDAELGRNQPVLGISVPLALWDRNQGGITAALRQADKAEAQLESTRAEVKAQAAEALEQLQSAVNQAGALQATVLPAARQALDIANRGYALGRFGILEVLDAQRTLFEVQAQALATTEQAFNAEARLIELFGDIASPRD